MAGVVGEMASPCLKQPYYLHPGLKGNRPQAEGGWNAHGRASGEQGDFPWALKVVCGFSQQSVPERLRVVWAE